MKSIRRMFMGKRSDSGENISGYICESMGQHYIITDGQKITRDDKKHPIQFQAYSIYNDDIGQYTGFRDKNLVCICENQSVSLFGFIGTIKFKYGAFGIVFDKRAPWDVIENQYYKKMDPRCGKANFLHNDTFISFWEICLNFNQSVSVPQIFCVRGDRQQQRNESFIVINLIKIYL